MMFGMPRRKMDNFGLVWVAREAIGGPPDENIFQTQLKRRQHRRTILKRLDGDIKLRVVGVHHAAKAVGSDHILQRRKEERNQKST